jgi:hypothetical protein
LVDVWLPVVKKLKENDRVIVDFIFPEPSSLRLECNESDLFNLSEKFSDKIIYRGYSGRWLVEDTLIKASKSIKFSKSDEKISRLANRLFIGRLSKYGFLRKMGKYIHLVHRHIIRIKEDIGGVEFYDINLLNNARGILCDITVENKLANVNLKNDLKDIPKFSMIHGIAPYWVTSTLICKQPVSKRLDVTVYNMSHLEVSGYKKCYGILEENIVHVGIPKHDSNWIEFISNQPGQSKEKVFDSFVFIIGRAASPYNTVERKKKALKDIYDIVCIKHGLKLVVKTHPKESINGIDGDIYMNALGKDNYGKDWLYSNLHPFILGKKALFAISFYSGVSLDMAAINKPTIEYLDLEGLPLYDKKDSLRDKLGKPVFQFRYADLVLGASSKADLEEHIESIFLQYETTFLPLHSRYKEYFKPIDGSSVTVANDIIRRLYKTVVI